MDRQLSNAREKLERAQRHAEEKRTLSQHTMERLKRDYDSMSNERSQNDKEMEDIRSQAEAIEEEVKSLSFDIVHISLQASQTASHLRHNEAELNDLLAEYWKIRHQTGEFSMVDYKALYRRLTC